MLSTTNAPRLPHRALAVAMVLIAATLAPGSTVEGQSLIEDQVRGVLEDAGVQDAISFIELNDEQTMADLVELTEIPAPPFMEQERARAFLAHLMELGVDTAYIDEVGNVIARRSGTTGDRVLAVSAHLDTVFPEGTDTRVRMAGDTLFAPGIGDDTRGLATLLAVLRALNASNVRTDADILFIGTVGEEGVGDLRGVRHLFRDGGPRIDTFISVDGTDHNEITHRALGSHRYKVTFSGSGGHSWGAFGQANPAHAMGRAIRYFQDAADRFTRSGAPTSYNVGRIGGGTSINSIPFEVWMEVDMRSESPSSLDNIDDLFQTAMQRALVEENELRRAGAPLVVAVDMIGDRPPGTISENDDFVRRAVAATRLFGANPVLDIGSTDSNIPISMGIPSVTIGGGGQGIASHAPGEGFINREGHIGVQRVLLIVVAEAGLARSS